MKMLVHSNAYGDHAYGIWWVDPDGTLQNLYTDPDGPQAARGRMIVLGKTNPDVPWAAWFDHLTARQPTFENWIIYDSMGMSPRQFLGSLNPLPLTA